MSCTINGSAGLTTNSGAVYNGISSGTAVTASGTSIDFTSIPSWVKRITVMLSGVSTNGSSPVQVQLGSGSVSTSGYLGGTLAYGVTSVASSNYTSGLAMYAGSGDSSSALRNGICSFSLLNGNTWSGFQNTFLSNANYGSNGATSITLGGTLDRLRITTANGTDTFDAGSINILYE